MTEPCSDTELLNWYEAAIRDEHQYTPEYIDGQWRYPYLVSGARGFGGGVGHKCFPSLRAAIKSAMQESL